MSLKRIFEIIGIFLVLFGINYLLDKNDLLYYNSLINIYFYVLVIVSLFYGLFAGLLFYGLYFGAEFLIYKSVNFEALSHYFIFLFIFSEFTYYWNKKIEKLQEENSYLKERIEDIGSAYYILKISHDELEKNYILKPFSIREVLREIKELLSKSKKEAANMFMTIMKNLFKVEKAAFYTKNGEFRLLGNIGEVKAIDFNDRLVKDALESGQVSFVGHLDEESKYLAVIPIVSLGGDVRGIFLIEDMPFFNLTKDNLITISLFATYFIHMIMLFDKYRDDMLDSEIVKEIETLRALSLNYKIENYLVIFYIQDEVERAFIKKYIRGSDVVFDYEDKVVVILPLTSSIGVSKFIERTGKKRYKIVDLSKSSLDEIKRLLK